LVLTVKGNLNGRGKKGKETDGLAETFAKKKKTSIREKVG